MVFWIVFKDLDVRKKARPVPSVRTNGLNHQCSLIAGCQNRKSFNERTPPSQLYVIDYFRNQQQSPKVWSALDVLRLET